VAINFLTTSDFIAQATVAAQSALSSLVDFSVGSIPGAFMNAIGATAQTIQAQNQYLLSTARLATCVGSAVDAFVGDYGLTRLPAVAASGQVTFTRYANSQPVLIAPGSEVSTTDGLNAYTVQTDTGNSYWNAGMSGYLMPSGLLSITLPIIATVAGAGSNVAANTITSINDGIAVNQVTNTLALTNGVNAESDDELKARFANYINTRSQATQAAVEYAITTVQQNLSYQIAENVAADGSPNAGSFEVFLDDGTGTPPSTLIANVSNAISVVKPLGIRFAVVPCIVVPAVVTMTVYPLPGYAKTDIVGPAIEAIEAYVNSLGVGNSLAASNLNFVVMSLEGVAKTESLLLNGSNVDIGGGLGQSVHIVTAPVVS
jgi:hypothetical protein